jgi:hypothetical protein
MNHRLPPTVLLPAMLALLAPGLGHACGEGLFHMGDGLRFQGYLAPRPAVVLVFDDDRTPPEERIRVYRGLVQAGHRLTVAHDADELAQAMQARQFDVVIAGLDAVDAVAAATPGTAPAPRLLPVVADRGRTGGDAAGGYAVVIAEGAGLGQYLRRINRLMAD